MSRKHDPLEFKYDADAVLERAADRLRAALAEAVSKLDPFPAFPGAFFSYGIEIEAPGLESPERGCIVLGEDAEFYELKMGTELPVYDMEFNDPVAMRKEELKPLEMHPQEYIIYAYNAITKVVELLMDQTPED
jgi:hypothetical protein